MSDECDPFRAPTSFPDMYIQRLSTCCVKVGTKGCTCENPTRAILVSPSLTDFLLARIAEDEAATHRPEYFLAHGTHMAYRQRAECKAKRTLIERAKTYELEWEMLIPLAAVYSDHPDWHEDWRL